MRRVLGSRHEGAIPRLHVEDDGGRARRELLREDRRGDERDRLHRPGHVAQSVEAPVGRGDGVGLPDERAADRVEEPVELRLRKRRPEARDRLELVERAARVAEAAARHHPRLHADGGEERREDERRLVADPAGRVLVRDESVARKVPGLAGLHHRERQDGRLGRRHAPATDGHQEGCRLLVRDRRRGDAATKSAISPRPARRRRASGRSSGRRGSLRGAAPSSDAAIFSRHSAASRGSSPRRASARSGRPRGPSRRPPSARRRSPSTT